MMTPPYARVCPTTAFRIGHATLPSPPRDPTVYTVSSRGSFATVKRATSVADGSEWAVKIIDKTKLAADDEAALKVEVEILQKVQHQLPAAVPRSQGVPCALELVCGCLLQAQWLLLFFSVTLGTSAIMTVLDLSVALAV